MWKNVENDGSVTGRWKKVMDTGNMFANIMEKDSESLSRLFYIKSEYTSVRRTRAIVP